MGKPRLVYVALLKAPFVKKDLEILGHHYRVKYQDFRIGGGLRMLKSFIVQYFFLLWHVPRSSRVVVMFGGYHSLLPALLGRLFLKKVYIILGGTDCVSFPSIDYGSFRKPILGKVNCASYRLAHMLLPVHHSLILRRDSYYAADSEFQGCRHWCKNLKTPYLEVHNGYDPEKWQVDRSKKVPHTFVTIAAIPDTSKIKLKGIDLIAEVAPLFPQCTFTIIGLQNAAIEISKEPNVKVLPFLPPEGLREVLEANRFYLQLSISEGFPNAICEAMLAECVPIGSHVAAIPEIIGENGFILEKRDGGELVSLLKRALGHPDLEGLGAAAKRHVAGNFPIDKREKGLMRAMGL